MDKPRVLSAAALWAGALIALGSGWAADRAQEPAAAAIPGQAPAQPEAVMPPRLDPIRIWFGMRAAELVPDIAPLIRDVRQYAAWELGIPVPPIRLQDNLELADDEFAVVIRGEIISRGMILANQLLAINASGTVAKPMEGTPVREITYRWPAVWIDPGQRAEAEGRGYLVVSPEAFIKNHVTEAIRQKAHHILGLGETRMLLEQVREYAPVSVEEALGAMPLPKIHMVLRSLLANGHSISQLPLILDAIACEGQDVKDVTVVAERARAWLEVGSYRPPALP